MDDIIYTTTITITLDLRCEVCGNDLDFHYHETSDVYYVKPCQDCK